MPAALQRGLQNREFVPFELHHDLIDRHDDLGRDLHEQFAR